MNGIATKGNWLAALGMGLVCGVWAQSPTNVLTSAIGISSDTGELRLAWVSKTLLNESFANGLGAWKTENYENALGFDKKQEGETPYLSIHREGGKCDTAFCLSAPAVDVTPGLLFDLRITARGTEVFMCAHGCNGNYPMHIQWLAANGKPVGTPFPFGLVCKKNDWQETRVSGCVPDGAVKAVVRIGADSPDILSGQPLDIGRVVFSAQMRGVNVLAGEAVSRPFPFAEAKAEVSWRATCPTGTRMTLDVSCAPDDNGMPGVWSPFVGPDGTAARAFEQTGGRLPPFPATARWLRYRVRLMSDSSAHSPVLSQVKVGARDDGVWRGADQTPPRLERCSPNLTADAAAPIVFRVSDPVCVNGATLHFWVDGKEETDALQRKDGTFIFTPKTPFSPLGKARDPKDVPPNLHQFRVSVEDQASNRLDESWPLLVGERNRHNRVTLRNDGAVLIDQKPFFPIGIYAVWKKEFNSNSFDRAFAELKANGFNVAHTYNSTRTDEFREFMDAAARQDFRLFLASGQGANCMDARVVLEDVARERVQPAVLAWYLADDTAMYAIPQQLASLAETVRAIDPDHITVQADGVGKPPNSNYAAFVGSTDGFLPEIYPIRGDGDVPQVITDMQTLRADIQAAGNPVKTVWPIIQYFEGWGWPRFPTADELRAMSFLAIIHGANGITWYTYGGHDKNHGATYTDETWRTLCGVVKEIGGLQEVLLSETCGAMQPTVVAGPAKDSQGHSSISVLVKRYQGRRYLLCANSAKAEVRADFALPDARKVTDRQDPSRALTFAGNTLTDAFPPYGVRIYVTE